MKSNAMVRPLQHFDILPTFKPTSEKEKSRSTLSVTFEAGNEWLISNLATNRVVTLDMQGIHANYWQNRQMD